MSTGVNQRKKRLARRQRYEASIDVSGVLDTGTTRREQHLAVVQRNRTLETVEQQATRRAKSLTTVRTRRMGETTEQQATRRAKSLTTVRTRLMAETAEQRATRRAKSLTTVRTRRMGETTEQQATRRAKSLTTVRAHLMAETAEQRATRGAKSLTTVRTHRLMETVEQQATRRAKSLTTVRTRRMGETTEQQATRRAKSLTTVRAHLMAETAEQRATRGAKSLTTVRTHRLMETVEQQATRRAKSLTTVRTHRMGETTEQQATRRANSLTTVLARLMAETAEQRATRRAKSLTTVRTHRLMETVEQQETRRAKSLTTFRARVTAETHEQRVSRRHRCLINLRRRRSTAMRLVSLATSKLRNIMADELKEQQKFSAAGRKFRALITGGLQSCCVSCHRLFHYRGVLKFQASKYTRCSEVVLQQSTGHTMPETFNKNFICATCHRSLKRGSMPAQSVGNALNLDDVPCQLAELTPLERHLISRRIPFYKLLALPRGKQLAIHGPVVNVPSVPSVVVDVLPRLATDTSIIPLKLKRKLTYRGHYMFGNIDVPRVSGALNWLATNNRLYCDVAMNQNWHQTWQAIGNDDITGGEVDDVMGDNQSTTSDDTVIYNEEDSDSDDTILYDYDEYEYETENQLRGIPHDTCMQEEDEQDIHDKIVSVAPAEHQRPIGLLTDEFFEELAFPDKFPHGSGGFSTQRKVRLTARKYFNQRLLNCDGRFARDTDYLFAAQYATEKKQITDNIMINVRQIRGVGKLNASIAKDPTRLQEAIRHDHAYRCLATVRGSPEYWRRNLLDLLAMVRQLGIPCWFMTLSAADLRWPELYMTIARQYGQILTPDEVQQLTWEQKCSYLRRNPVTVARMYDFRLKSFFTEFLKSDAHPIGVITNYYYKIEFQQRGSPHAHMLIWIEDAPLLNVNTDAEVCSFIDRYQRCAIPANQKSANLVTDLQKHAHSKSCMKKRNTCRFHFPQVISRRTMIVRRPDSSPEQMAAQKATARGVIKRVRETFDRCLVHTATLDSILAEVGVTVEEYEWAINLTTEAEKLILKRKPSEGNINGYNLAVLKYWEANMDLSYVVNAYACIVYITSYMMKEERNISELLMETAKESTQCSVKEQLRKVGSCFLTHREVSAQEAVYRLLSLRLKESTSTVVFVNASSPESRVSVLRSTSDIADRADDDEDIFYHNLIDRYPARPRELENLSLAEFAANYSCCLQSDSGENVIRLVNSDGNFLGCMKRRKKMAVIRYPRFKDGTEQFFRSQLMLFSPWRKEDVDLLTDHHTFAESYDAKRTVIDRVECIFVKNASAFQLAVEELDKGAASEDAWDYLAPGAQAEDAECQVEGTDDVTHFDAVETLEDFSHHRPSDMPDIAAKFRTNNVTNVLSNEEYCKAIRSLNCGQKRVVSFNRHWLKQYVHSFNKGLEQPVPYFIYMAGGGGVGKSHVIRMIYTDCVKLLKNCRRQDNDLFEPSETCVLLTAPTGTAAFNIRGLTLHSALMLGAMFFSKLSADTLNTLRNCIGKLVLLVIDEISMVGAEMLLEVDRRLRQIMASDKLFGGVSILAAGDLYQLPPVQQRSIFALSRNPKLVLYGSPWLDYVNMIELTENMRQLDRQFSDILGRIRVGKHTTQDEAVLETRLLAVQREDPAYPMHVLHIFATNKECEEYNIYCLTKLGNPVYHVRAIDSKQDKRTRLLNTENLNIEQRKTGGLRDSITLAVNARVMLIANVNVSDGLSNGVMGLIRDIIVKDGQVQSVQVQFDNAAVGKLVATENPYRRQYPDCVDIQRLKLNYTYGKGKTVEVTRSQFPLSLAFACTIHKVQGMTLDRVVISMKSRFGPGQAYVAISRVRTLDGLHLLDFDRKKIIVNKEVIAEMNRLRQRPSILPEIPQALSTGTAELTMVHLNVRSLQCHRQDVINDDIVQQSDIACFNETSLRQHTTFSYQAFPWDGSQCYTASRSDDDAAARGGGVLVAVRNMCSELLHVSRQPGMEAVLVTVTTASGPFHVCSVYRHPQTTRGQFRHAIADVISHMTPGVPAAVVGDVNDDQSAADGTNNSWVSQAILDHGFIAQCMPSPTTDYGSTIDRVYTRDINTVEIRVADCYYSDHDLVILSLAAN